MVGLRGAGKTVLLDRMREDAEATGLQTLRIEAPEGRSLPAMLAPELRVALIKLSINQQAKDLAALPVEFRRRLIIPRCRTAASANPVQKSRCTLADG
jgi:hypothetical protein